MHLIIDYSRLQVGGFDGKNILLKPIFRDEERLPEQIQDFLEQNNLTISSLQSVIIATKGARFSDVRAATVTANLLAYFKSLALYELDSDCLDAKELNKLLQSPPKIFIEPQYSSPPSITKA